jgi:hypothetical protein
MMSIGPDRLLKAVLIAATIAVCWLAMQAVHEFGHVLHAWASGGRVTRVVLSPLQISRTDVEPDPRPQFVAWGGPVWGSVLPVLFWLAARGVGWPRAWWLRFFAGFCLIANGGYLLGGSIFPVGDAEVLIRHGASRVQLVTFGITTVLPGLFLWNRLGPHFGLGFGTAPVDRRAAVGATVALLVLLAAEWLCG